MSLTRIKLAFSEAFRCRLKPAHFEQCWLQFARSLVAEAGDESLWIPNSVPDPAAAQRQGDLFATDHAAGMSIRKMSEKHKIPATTVHRMLVFQRRVGIGTAA